MLLNSTPACHGMLPRQGKLNMNFPLLCRCNQTSCGGMATRKEQHTLTIFPHSDPDYCHVRIWHGGGGEGDWPSSRCDIVLPRRMDQPARRSRSCGIIIIQIQIGFVCHVDILLFFVGRWPHSLFPSGYMYLTQSDGPYGTLTNNHSDN